MFDAYRQALRAPGAMAFYLAAAPARVGIAMTVLGMVWLVHGATGSYAQAGLATGAFALTEAVIGPQSARLIDAFGQTRVVPLLLAAHGVCVAGLIAGGPAIVLAGLAGATIPQVGALAAARWSHVVRGPLLSTGFALEAIANGIAFLAGPAIVGVVAATVDARAGAALAAALVIAGGLALCAQRGSAPPPARRGERARRGEPSSSGETRHSRLTSPDGDGAGRSEPGSLRKTTRSRLTLPGKDRSGEPVGAGDERAGAAGEGSVGGVGRGGEPGSSDHARRSRLTSPGSGRSDERVGDEGAVGGVGRGGEPGSSDGARRSRLTSPAKGRGDEGAVRGAGRGGEPGSSDDARRSRLTSPGTGRGGEPVGAGDECAGVAGEGAGGEAGDERAGVVREGAGGQAGAAVALSPRRRARLRAAGPPEGVGRVIAANVALGGVFGSLQVSVTAFAVDSGAAAFAGPLYAITSAASLLSGFVYGRRARTLRLRTAFAVLALGCAPLLLVTTPVQLAFALIVPGLAIAPILTLSSVITQARVESAVLTQAFTWLNSAAVAGVAMAAAVSGQLVDEKGPQAAFALAVLAAAAGHRIASRLRP